MTPESADLRAGDARMLIEHPLIQGAFKDLTEAYTDLLLKAEDERGVMRLRDALKVLRQVEVQLKSHIATGRLHGRADNMSDESAEPIEEGAAPEAGTDEPRHLNTMEETAEAMRGFFPDDEPAQEADSAAPDADAGPEALSPEPEAAEPAFQMLVDGEMQTVPLSKLQEAYTGTLTQQPVQPAFTEEQALALRQGNAERQKTDDWANQVRTYLTSPLPDPPPLNI